MSPLTPTERPTTIALANDFDIWLDGTKVRGTPSDVLVLRGFIGLSRLSAAPIHATLAAEAVSQGGGSGDYLASIPGTAITTHLSGLLHRVVWVIAESVPPGSYRDSFPVTVVEDQSP